MSVRSSDAGNLHAALQPLAWLIGAWEGRGKGIYPTIDDFEYVERIEFAHDGRPILRYLQTTSSPETGAPMHSETGYWKILPDGMIEMVMAHTFGIVEVQEGTFDESSIRVKSRSLTSTGSAKEVTSIERSYRLDDDVLHSETSMGAVGQPHQRHLTSTLRKIAG